MKNAEPPARQPYELDATAEQKSYLWDAGYHDQTMIDGLGKTQASALIEKHKAKQRAGNIPLMFGISIFAAGLAALYLSQQKQKPRPPSPVATQLEGGPAASSQRISYDPATRTFDDQSSKISAKYEGIGMKSSNTPPVPTPNPRTVGGRTELDQGAYP